MATKTPRKNSSIVEKEVKRLREEIGLLDKKIDREVFSLSTQIRQGSSKTQDLVLEVLAEVKDMREEQAAHQMGHIRQQDTLDKQEERLKKLEKIHPQGKHASL